MAWWRDDLRLRRNDRAQAARATPAGSLDAHARGRMTKGDGTSRRSTGWGGSAPAGPTAHPWPPSSRRRTGCGQRFAADRSCGAPLGLLVGMPSRSASARRRPPRPTSTAWITASLAEPAAKRRRASSTGSRGLGSTASWPSSVSLRSPTLNPPRWLPATYPARRSRCHAQSVSYSSVDNPPWAKTFFADPWILRQLFQQGSRDSRPVAVLAWAGIVLAVNRRPRRR
jgi:hypothetical protein